MACAERGSIRGVSWHTGTPPVRPALLPLFSANDNGDIDYRAISAAAARLWRDYGLLAPQTAATRAQSAFWQGQMATCRWWHSVARMLDRALLAGECLTAEPQQCKTAKPADRLPANR
jgi:hypothetical protein